MSASEYISMITSSNLTLRNIGGDRAGGEQSASGTFGAATQPETDEFVFRTDEGSRPIPLPWYSRPFGDGGATGHECGLEESRSN